jgi:tetratricopeptide (TPR) repeat protein
MLEHNLTSPVISPNGRWLIYLPVERYTDRVGPGFAARAAGKLEAQRLDQPGPPVSLTLDLPGLSGQPAFSTDGQYLYVVQFFSDSNHDGVIDAGDHGILFRVAFPSDLDDAPAKAAAATPEQLTDASWNCQYPSPSGTKLVTTCASEQGLDIYQLPLEGEVPPGWSDQRLALELGLVGRESEQILLYRMGLSKQPSISARRLLLMRLVRLHLQLDEFKAAEFYAQHLHALRDPATHGLAHSLFLQIEHREALRERERGRMAEDFEEEARKRMAKLSPRPGDSPAAVVFEHIVHSELADTMGDKVTARRELERAQVNGETPPSVIEAYYERADALLRELDDREALVEVCRALSMNGALAPADQLVYARAAVRNLTRGRGYDEASQALAKEQVKAKAGSELEFALELGRAALAVRDDQPSLAVRGAIMALYHRQTRIDRQRAVMLEAVARASDLGADKVIEGLAQEYLSAVAPGTQERGRAEHLYGRAIMGRAYRRLAEGHLPGALADFEAVARNLGSLEAAVAAVNMRLSRGESTDVVAQEVLGVWPAHARAAKSFVESYLKARALPKLAGEAHKKAVAEAMAPLTGAWPELSTEGLAHALLGAILHEDYMRDGNGVSAERANVHYLVGLGISGADPRYRAMVLGQLGILNTQVGNYRAGLGYLQDRQKLPYVDDAQGLASRLAESKALLHVSLEDEAAKAADQALAAVERSLGLRPYRKLTLDRDALIHLAAGRFERALELYEALEPALASDSGPGAERNELVVHLAHGAAALGASRAAVALSDLDRVDRLLLDPQVTKLLVWPHTGHEEVVRSYRLIASGLRANAARMVGSTQDAVSALRTRRALVLERLKSAERDDDLRLASLVELRLGQGAAAQKDWVSAGKWGASAYDHAGTWLKRTHAPLHAGPLDALWFAGQLRALAQVPVPFDVQRELRRSQTKIEELKDPVWMPYHRWFEVLLALPEP